MLLVNPRSGGGKAAVAGLVELARRARLDVVTVAPGENLADLAEAAAAEGAGVLGVAGGDGSMAAVAAVAARHGLPFVCVPTGTRNHFALDLGLDPRDPAQALSAFRRGVQVRVDLAEVNGSPFVNNVSLGAYAALVGSRHYRRSKLRALLDEMPDVIGPGSSPSPVRFRAPDGRRLVGVQALLVSNNSYRLGGLGQGAWRPRLDSGSLGVLSVTVDDGRAAARLALQELLGRRHPSSGYARWRTPDLTVDADGPLAAGLDGEPTSLAPPLRFVSRPASLLVLLPVRSPRGAVRRLTEQAVHLVGHAVTTVDRPGSRQERGVQQPMDRADQDERAGGAGTSRSTA